jgi:hypothetical protein
MIMLRAFWIEGGIAVATVVTRRQVVGNCHFMSADSAQNRPNTKLLPAPNFVTMTGFLLVAVKARIVITAAFKFYCDHIKRRVIMHATCLIIDCLSLHSGK